MFNPNQNKPQEAYSCESTTGLRTNRKKNKINDFFLQFTPFQKQKIRSIGDFLGQKSIWCLFRTANRCFRRF